MLIQRKIRFVLHKRKASDTIASLRMRVTLRGQKPIDFPLQGYKLEVAHWDASTERYLATTSEAIEINRAIEEHRAGIHELFTRYELLEKRIPTPAEIKDLYDDMTGRRPLYLLHEQEHNLWGALDTFTQQEGAKNQWTHSTHQKFNNLKRHLQEFDPRLSFSDISEEKLQRLIGYYNSQGLRNTTIAKHLAFLRWFLRWAHSRGLYKGNVHDTFRPRLKGTSVDSKEIIYLSQSELKQLRDFPDLSPSLERVRDVFLFQCFTGLRYSDVAKLRRSDIKHGVLHVVTQKTIDGLRIELNKHSLAILDKYKGDKFSGDKALPIISNVKMNEYLKTIGQLVGLNEPTRIVFFQGNQRREEVYPKWQLLTTHVGRRTFVVTALQLGIPVEVIMRWTGHSNFEAMKPYAKIVDELKAQSMSKFDIL